MLAKIREVGEPEAATFFGVSPRLVSQWLAGSKSPSLAAVEKVFSPINPSGSAAVQEAGWEGKNVMLCLPWYRDVHPLTAMALVSVFDRPKMGVLLNFGNSLISESRNIIARRFMESPAEWSFWVDSDVVFPTGNAAWFNSVTGFNFPDKFAGMHSMNRLMGSGKSLVGGYYFTREERSNPTFAEGWKNVSVQLECRKGPKDEVRQTEWIATGCLMVHRSVFESISTKHPSLKGKWFSANSPDEAMSGMGEDILFCKHATEAGHPPFVDLGVVCGHVGDKIYGPFNSNPK